MDTTKPLRRIIGTVNRQMERAAHSILGNTSLSVKNQKKLIVGGILTALALGLIVVYAEPVVMLSNFLNSISALLDKLERANKK